MFLCSCTSNQIHRIQHFHLLHTPRASTMALQPHLAFTSIGSGPNTLELWLDLCCPHCAKCTGNLASFLVPSVLPGGSYHGKLRILIRPYPQPWDPPGGWVAEATLAFGRALCSEANRFDSELWFKYFSVLMERQRDFKGCQVADMSANQIKEKLYGIAAEVVKGGNGEKSGLSKEEVAKSMSECVSTSSSRKLRITSSH